ncbi:MAG: hypothetical protein JWM11_3459, partial [Planctomycetaceae bacterium]|nr:hypothetical protein [Planctomycetaceae bacterium]
DRANFNQVEMIIDTNSFKPVALRFTNPTGSSADVYLFTDVQFNTPEGPDNLNPPNLQGYKTNIHSASPTK